MFFRHLIYCANEGPHVDTPHSKTLVMVSWAELARPPGSYGSPDEYGGRMMGTENGNTISCYCGAPMMRISNVTPEQLAKIVARSADA